MGMLAMLASDELQRQDRCVEAVYFIQQFYALWQTTLQSAAKTDAYYKLSPEEREATQFEAFVTPEEALEGLTLPNNDPCAMLCWAPTENFTRVMGVALQETPKGIPSVFLLQNLPLTLHYALWLADAVERCGFPKHALSVLGWVRAIFCICPTLEKREAVFAVLHYRAISVMMR